MEISSTAIVSPRAKIAENVVIGPFCIIEEEVEIGAGTVLDSHVVIKKYTTLGENNRLHMGVMLGSDPEDKHFSGQRSYLRIGNRNILREYSTASRGTPPESTTVIGDDNYIMIGVHVAHNCRLGNNIVVCNNCSLAGYVEVEDGAFLSGGVRGPSVLEDRAAGHDRRQHPRQRGRSAVPADFGFQRHGQRAEPGGLGAGRNRQGSCPEIEASLRDSLSFPFVR